MFSSLISYCAEELRNLTLDLLFKGIGYLSGHKFVHVQEDTAELVHDRRGLKISFVYGGQPHSVVLPFNPYKIEHREYVVYAEGEDLPLANLCSSLPGLDDVLFSKETLGKVFSCTIDRVESNFEEE
jgi:hypothetical protein